MKYVDRNSNFERVPASVRPLVRGLLENTRRFSEDDGENAPYVTEALKYTAKAQERRTTDTTDPSEPFLKSVAEVFGFSPLEFQKESWQLLSDLDEARTNTGRSQGAIISAPTGFGKTEGFLGPLYQLLREDRQEMAILVYPRRALLQDQLGRVLKHIHSINDSSDEELSVGVWMGGVPNKLENVETSSALFSRSGSTRTFRLADCWCGGDDENHSFVYSGGRDGYEIVCENDPAHSFSYRELKLSRRSMQGGDHPDILLTTLESLELFGLKPNYDIIHYADTIVFDEIHLYTGLRGAHTAKIVENIESVTDDSLLWVGSSATVDDAQRFAGKIFPVDEDNVAPVKPRGSDFDEDHDDKEHYYFLKATEDGPGVSSMFIQQILLLGHGLLETEAGSRGKILSFIDSISQVNQKRSQLEDADHNRRLWTHHVDTGGPGDWNRVADEMDYRFLRKDLSFSHVYSDRGYDASILDNDVLLSTNFLEVGIDVGDISIVTQYRTPWDLSSFVQRVGRAARKPDTDSHIFVFLADLTSDANMFYRADRFLGSEIRTPLKTDNDVVAWIHEQFETFYEVSDDVYRRRLHGQREKRTFHEEYLVDELGWDDYHQLLTDPAAVLERDLGIHESLDPLTGQEPVQELRSRLEFERDDLKSRIEEAEATDIGGVQETLLAFLQERTSLEQECSEHPDFTADDVLQELSEELDSVRETVTAENGTATPSLSDIESVRPALYRISGHVVSIQQQATANDIEVQGLEFDVSDVESAIGALRTSANEEEAEELKRRRQRVYYLIQALDQLEEYHRIPSNHLSLYFVKYLLRGGYFFDRFLRLGGGSLSEEVWYIPENYFDGAGKYFTVFHGRGDEDGSEESIDALVHSYTPFRSEYQSEGEQLQAFLPDTVVDGDNVRFDFSDVRGDVQDDILVPDEIRLSQVSDLSGTKALNIVRYCPVCYEILEIDSCPRHNASTLGKIHSSPQIETELTERTDDAVRGGVTLADVSGKVRLTGASLQITPATNAGGETGYIFTGGDRIEQLIETPEPTLGFSLDTRGLLFDVTEFLQVVDDEAVMERVSRYKAFDDLSPTEVAIHTAAHFYTQFVADLAGISPTSLFYGFDVDEGTVYIFERSQGGQGIVDLVFDDIREDPATALEAITRIAYNPQVLNERLWADEPFVDELTFDGDRDAITAQVQGSDHAPIFDHVTELLVEEVHSSVDRIHQFAREEDFSPRKAAKVRQTIASERVDGTDEYPKSAVKAVAPEVSDHERAKSLFFSPDIDGCVDNLHLSECISAYDQSSTLSYVLLETLREQIIERIPADEAGESMFDYEVIPGGEYGDTSVFVTL